MKDSKLNIRLDDETKTALLLLSKINDAPISSIVRAILKKYVDTQENNILPNGDLELLQSLGFCEVIFWITDKLRDPELSECNALYLSHIKLLKEMENNSFFDEEILVEFRKVYNELEYVVTNEVDYDYVFQFPNSTNGFNYGKLYIFMNTIRYDDNDEMVLYIK